MKKPPPRSPSSSRNKTKPLLLVANLVGRYLTGLLIAGVAFGFYLLMYRKEQIHSLKGDAAIVMGLLAVVAVVLYLNPEVQQKIARWRRARNEKREDTFWKTRDANDVRQAEAQTRAAQERAARIAAREARLAALKNDDQTQP